MLWHVPGAAQFSVNWVSVIGHNITQCWMVSFNRVFSQADNHEGSSFYHHVVHVFINVRVCVCACVAILSCKCPFCVLFLSYSASLLQLLFQETNPGVRYEYTISRGDADSENDIVVLDFLWKYGSWTECSATCGTGKAVQEKIRFCFPNSTL